MISVLIPVYNGERFLAEALESAFAQRGVEIEVLVVDDGSTDQTAAVLERFPRARRIAQAHQGVAAARNRLLREARGEYAAFLDSDDLFVSGKLKKQLDYLRKHPQTPIVFALMVNQWQVGDPLKIDQRLLDKLFLSEKALPTALIRKSAFDAVGLFDERIAIREDFEWYLRLRMAGLPTPTLMDEILYIRRVHASNMSISGLSTRRPNNHEIIAAARRNLTLHRKKVGK